MGAKLNINSNWASIPAGACWRTEHILPGRFDQSDASGTQRNHPRNPSPRSSPGRFRFARRAPSWPSDRLGNSDKRACWLHASLHRVLIVAQATHKNNTGQEGMRKRGVRSPWLLRDIGNIVTGSCVKVASPTEQGHACQIHAQHLAGDPLIEATYGRFGLDLDHPAHVEVCSKERKVSQVSSISPTVLIMLRATQMSWEPPTALVTRRLKSSGTLHPIPALYRPFRAEPSCLKAHFLGSRRALNFLR